jgi:hypothetical protein
MPDALNAMSVPTIIHPAAGDSPKTAKIVLNKAPRLYYSFTDVGDAGLPAILERSWESIPVTTVVTDQKRSRRNVMRLTL